MGCIPLLFCWYWNSASQAKDVSNLCKSFLMESSRLSPSLQFYKAQYFMQMCVPAWGMQLMFLWLDKKRFRRNMWPVPVVAVWHGLKNSGHLRICLCLDLHFDVENIFLKETVLRITCRLTRVTPEWMQRRTESLQVKFVFVNISFWYRGMFVILLNHSNL